MAGDAGATGGAVQDGMKEEPDGMKEEPIVRCPHDRPDFADREPEKMICPSREPDFQERYKEEQHIA